MPIYDLICKTCNKEFEFFKLKSDEKTECPHCGEKEQSKFEKQVSKNTGFTFKSGKWFKQGY